MANSTTGDVAYESRFTHRWPSLLSVKMVAEYLDVSVSWVRQASNPGRGVLKPVSLEGMIRYRKSDVDDFIDSLPLATSRKVAARRSARTERARSEK
jgi:predicted DNA-binding transcriptional regulator AlpA